MVPVIIKLWHQRYLFSRVRPKGHSKSHVQLSAASRWDSRSPSSVVSMSGYQLINKPAPLGIKTLGPGPRSLPPNAGSGPVQTLEVCERIYYCFYYVNFGIVWCYGYDKIVFYAYCFIFSVYCAFLLLLLLLLLFLLKDNEVIFGCIGLTDTVVLQ